MVNRLIPSAGFSLLELVFVAGIAATLSAVAVPQYLTAIDDSRAAGAARYISARFQRARMEAVSANRSRRVDASRRRADLSGRLSRRRAAQAVAEAEAAAEAEADEDVATKVEDASTETKQDGLVTEETSTEETSTEETDSSESVAEDAVEDETDDGAAAMVEEADDPASAEAGADEKGK